MPPKKFVMKKTQVPASAFAATYLIIVESPSKCSKIESFLGKEYACIASMGHIRHIAGLGSIDVKNQFAINFDILPDKKVLSSLRMVQSFLQTIVYLERVEEHFQTVVRNNSV